MSRARAQIRRPLDSRAQVTIIVVDTHGEVLGLVRSPDAPSSASTSSLQKARTAAFFSEPPSRRPSCCAESAAPTSRSYVAATRDLPQRSRRR